MSNNPPPRPPPIGYRSKTIEDSNARRNTPLKFMGRMCLGVCLGVGGCVAGGMLASYTNVQALFFVPLGAALATALVIAIKFKRYGYVTGVILAPFIIVAAIIILLLIVCGGMAHH